MYRHDGARSGSTPVGVPADLKSIWRENLGGRLSAPVVADGRLFVATVDAHSIHALDANNGQTLWTYTTRGRLDSPPTIHGDLALFGSADGWVYCLRASDGELAWKFRAAPKERLVGSFVDLHSLRFPFQLFPALLGGNRYSVHSEKHGEPADHPEREVFFHGLLLVVVSERSNSSTGAANRS